MSESYGGVLHSTGAASDPVVKVRDLAKSFGRRHVLRGLTFEVFRGEVFGILGPNGAGKTTTLRLLTGLAKPSHGSIEVFGASVPEGFSRISRRIGAVVESVGIHGHLSALENLRVVALEYGIRCKRERLGQLLETAGLEGVGKRPARTFSTGMRQRLGLASALVCSPELLILDEPTLGLDPSGVHELRVLLTELSREGCTIILSSNQLLEVELLCERILFIDQGVAKKYGRLDELLGTRTEIVFTVSDSNRAREALVGFGERVRTEGNRVVLVDPSRREDVTRALVTAGIYPEEISSMKTGLEDLFLDEIASRTGE